MRQRVMPFGLRVLLGLAQAVSGCDCGVVPAGSGDAGGNDSGNAQVGQLPVVTIASPTNGSSVQAGASVSFAGHADDAEDGVLTGAALIWSSSIDGRIGVGDSVLNALVNAGQHTISLTATDSDGNSVSASISLTVSASALPVVRIVSPEPGQQAAIGESIDFHAEVTPPQGHTVANSDIVWRSDRAGQIGIGATIRTGLATQGAHIITCTAADDAGGQGSATVNIEVVGNRAPQVSIERPRDGDYFGSNQTIDFRGAATDAEDGALSGSALVWTSSVTGQFGLGGQVSTALPLGDHVVTLRATDSAGAVGEAQITIHVVSNLPPRCTINDPNNGANFVAGDSIAFNGSCTDVESGAVTQGLRWTSSLDGQLGLGATVQTVLPTLGQHTIQLCAPDPVDANLIGCASIDITIQRVNRPPVVTIDSVSQNSSTAQPFGAGVAIALAATASDPDGDALTLSWVDSIEGPIGSAASATLAVPLVGRHRVVLTATDTVGATASANVTFLVLAGGQTTLVDRFGAIGQPQVRDLASAGSRVYFGNATAQVLTFDATNLGATTSVAAGSSVLPDDVNDIFIDAVNGLIYLATRDGLVVCDFSVATGIDTGACNTFRDGSIPAQNNNLQAVARVTGSDSQDYLLIGNGDGLLVASDAAGSNGGQQALDGRDVRAVAAGDGVAWIGTNGDGLIRFDPVSRESQRWNQDAGAPSDNLRAVAVGFGGSPIWVGSDAGLGRYEPAGNQWTVWQQGDPPAPGLVSDDVRALAIQRVTIDSVARDVVWAGTGGGVSRFDPSVPSFMNLTTADGLPSNSVRSIVVLNDGSKIFGTDSGIARYVGP